MSGDGTEAILDAVCTAWLSGSQTKLLLRGILVLIE